MTYYIIIRGPLGCGKSTLSAKLAKQIRAKHISIDRVLDTFNKTFEKGYVSQASFRKANMLIVPEAKKLLNRGIPVVFDGNFYWRSQITDLTKRLKYPHSVFTLKASLRLCISRDSKRHKTHGKDAEVAVFRKSTSFTYGTVIDVSRPIGVCLKRIRAHLPL